MLADLDVMATVAVRDMAVASRFYEETLGLTRTHSEGSEAYEYKAGGTRLLVYRSEYAGTNQATAVTWTVGDQIDAIVRALQEKGVWFERYEFPGVKLEGNIHVMGPMKNAWFKDPDGNIHAIVGS